MSATSGALPPHIQALSINGYKPFREFRIDQLLQLNVIVGANGSGKSSLFEFLRFLRDGMLRELQPEIVADTIGQQIFHRPGPDKLSWELHIYLPIPAHVSYYGEVHGPVGQTRVAFEGAHVMSEKPRLLHNFDASLRESDQGLLMRIRGGAGFVQDKETGAVTRQETLLGRPNLLTLSTMHNSKLATLYSLREFIAGWRFYNGFNVNTRKIRGPVTLEQEPVLHEDCGNLSAVLFYLANEHRDRFDDLKVWLRLAVPRFADLSVKARGLGQVLAFWKEQGVEDDFSLADLSDGALRFLCWAVLTLMPDPPTMLCLDEPELGLHPHALSILAGLFQTASYRAPILLATHSSYFLTLFDLNSIAVMKKTEGGSVLVRPADSAALRANLDEFGASEIETMHRSGELEALTPEATHD